MTKWLIALMLMLGLATFNLGCEASGEIDDDGAEIKVDD